MRTTTASAQPEPVHQAPGAPRSGRAAGDGDREPFNAADDRRGGPFLTADDRAGQPFRAADVGLAEAERLLRAGLARTVLADVLVAVDAPDSRQLRATAARLLIPAAAWPPDWVVGFGSALWLHTGTLGPLGPLGTAGTVRRAAPAELQVVIPVGRRRPARPGIRARQVVLPADQVVRAGPVLVTDPTRTAADVARDLPAAEALVALERLSELCDVRPDQVLRVLATMRYARGTATARKLVTRWART